MFLSMSTGTGTVCQASSFTLLLLCTTTAFEISGIGLRRLINFSCDQETTCSGGSLTWVDMRRWTCRRTRSGWCYMSVMCYFAGLYSGGLCWCVLWVNKEPRRSIILGESYLSAYPFISVEVSVRISTIIWWNVCYWYIASKNIYFTIF